MEFSEKFRIDNDSWLEDSEVNEVWKCTPRRTHGGFLVKEVKVKEDIFCRVTSIGKELKLECENCENQPCRHTLSVYSELGYLTITEHVAEKLDDVSGEIEEKMREEDDNWDLKKKDVERQRKLITSKSGI